MDMRATRKIGMNHMWIPYNIKCFDNFGSRKYALIYFGCRICMANGHPRSKTCEKSNGLVVSIITLSDILLGPAICIALEVPLQEVESTTKSSPNNAVLEKLPMDAFSDSFPPVFLCLSCYRRHGLL